MDTDLNKEEKPKTESQTVQILHRVDARKACNYAQSH